MVRDPSTGKYRRTRLFVLTLGYSRKSVRLLLWRSTTHVWAELHERAFRRLGGTVKVVVLDNLREGVLTPDIYDPALNPLYRDVLAITASSRCPVASAIPIAKAAYLGLSPGTLRNWVSTGRIDYVKVGRLTRISLAVLDRYIEQQTIRAVEGADR